MSPARGSWIGVRPRYQGIPVERSNGRYFARSKGGVSRDVEQKVGGNTQLSGDDDEYRLRSVVVGGRSPHTDRDDYDGRHT